MGLFSKDIKSMSELFLHGVQDMYYAEQQIVKALPKLIEKAKDTQLKTGLEKHLRETQDQVKQLEKVFEMQDESPKGTKCPAMDGILREGDELMNEVEDDVLDAALIGAAQAVEHYEISRYGTLVTWARELGRNNVARVLNQILDQEKATDKKLTALAERNVNPEADELRPSRNKARATMGRKRTTLARSRRVAGRNAKSAPKKAASKRKSRSRKRA